jgi:chromosome segregation ATPase
MFGYEDELQDEIRELEDEIRELKAENENLKLRLSDVRSSQTKIIQESDESWKNIFTKQVSSGKYWKNLFKDEFDRHQFLDRSDAVYICKKAQADAYQNVINKLHGKIDDDSLNEIKQILDNLWEDDDSALGMIR